MRENKISAISAITLTPGLNYQPRPRLMPRIHIKIIQDKREGISDDIVKR